MSGRSPLLRVIGLLGAHRGRTAVTFGLGFAVIGLSTALPLVTRAVIDDAVLPGRTDLVVTGVLALLGLAALRWACGSLRRAAGGVIALDVEYDLRSRLARRLLALESGRSDALPTGQVMSRLGTDMGAIKGFLAFGFLYGVINALTAVAALAQMAFLSPALTLAVLPTTVLFAVVAVRYDARQRAVFRALYAKEGDLAAETEETAAGIATVKALGVEDLRQERFERVSAGLMTEGLRAARLRARFGTPLGALPALGQATILWYGGHLVIDGALTLGTLISFNAYLLLLTGPMYLLSAMTGVIRRATAAAERVFEILDRTPAITDGPLTAPRPPEGPRGARVVFEGIGVHPEGASRPVLADVHLAVEPGERVLITGPNGAGKSTLLALIPRLTAPTTGRVTLDGHDIADLTLASLREQVAIVPQHPILLSGTLRENVALGRPDAPDGDILTALETAGALDLLDALPGGLDTRIGEHGDTLSGGQRQRLAIARALLTHPRLLLLDDALSQVDAATAASVVTRLTTALPGMTILTTGPGALHHLTTRTIHLANGRTATPSRAMAGMRGADER
ncbi:ABC transporter ATP-binding protein [Spongiactinospora sp. TRM90649]|uniref:ABC transporter ATP-binding protein n=1 Tax=Spongiactinospora sp. TRM90649 TaxID=3031114 RepID=UPI0023F96E20|nr:ABC transporter ATP-binding protein [Spongiactinospora sp. TRM90649]MDF5753225.1 ABC transporter ATP-binding protein [Spongiactinospora sp. TRM90649]